MEFLALALAVLRVASALALGGWLTGRLERRGLLPASGGALWILLAVLLGLAIQGGAHFLLAKTGWGEVVAPALALDALFLAFLWPGWASVRRGWEAIHGEYRGYLDGTGRWGKAILIAGAALLFILAAGPPRDTDVLRYHLALPQQIVTEGDFPLWRNYHYHFPQAYTFAMMSELAIGTPPAVQMVSALLYVLLGAGLISLCRGASRPALLVLGGMFFFHPGMLKMATTAHSDIIIFISSTIPFGYLLAARERPPAVPWIAAAGLATGIGMAFRYQQAGWVVALPIAVLIVFRRPSILLPCLGGLAAAALVVWPFYAVNALEMGNPVWPLAIPLFNGPEDYANYLGGLFTSAVKGTTMFSKEPHALSGVIQAVRTMLVDPFLAGGALLVFVALPLSFVIPRLRPAGVLLTVFVVVWWLVQPRLYPRFVLMLLPICFVIATAAWDLRSRVSRTVIRAGLLLWLVGLVGLTAWYAVDYVDYYVTRDSDEFHRHTWFYTSHTRLNEMLDDSTRTLVIARSGDTFYLRVPYLRADPVFAGEVDWRTVDTASELAESSLEMGMTHIFFHDTPWWEGAPFGREMRQTVHALMADSSRARVIGRWEQELSLSRVRNEFIVEPVYLIELRDRARTRE